MYIHVRVHDSMNTNEELHFLAALELTSTKYRKYAATSPYYCFLLGYAALSLYGYFIRSWRKLIWVGTFLIVPYVYLVL